MMKILVVGELVLDFITSKYGVDLNSAKSFDLSYGGSPGNIARNLSDIGIKSILFTRVGNDSFGENFRRKMNDRKVDVSLMQMDEERNTSMVFINKSKDTPDFFPLRGADYKLKYDERLDDLLDDISIIHLSSWPISKEPSRTTVERIVKKSKEKNIKICFDPNYREKLWQKNHNGFEYIKNFVKNVYLIKPSEDDSYHLFKKKMFPHEYIFKYLEFGAKYVVLTMGKDGSLVSDGKEFVKINTLANDVYDTTGAGDALWAGLYYGILHGYDIFKSTLIGTCLSAFKIALKNKEEKIPDVRELYKKYTGKVL